MGFFLDFVSNRTFFLYVYCSVCSFRTQPVSFFFLSRTENKNLDLEYISHSLVAYIFYRLHEVTRPTACRRSVDDVKNKLYNLLTASVHCRLTIENKLVEQELEKKDLKLCMYVKKMCGLTNQDV